MSMSDRRSVRERFLADNGWPPNAASLLAADASFRRYFRLRDGGRGAVLMDAPPPREDVRPFVAIARHLCALGLSAPAVEAVDSEQGFVLLEDLGDDTYSRLLDRGAGTAELYRLAVDTLIHLHRHQDAAAIDVPAYDTERLLQEAALFTDWFMPALLDVATTNQTRHEYLLLWRSILSELPREPPTLVLRDYHVDNLMRLPQRPGVRACALLDFQDAVVGHRAYDLMSLLEDARRDVPHTLQEALLTRYRNAFPRTTGGFTQAYAALALQRHCKVAGIFMRLFVRDGKAAYLQHLPRVMRLLESGLRRSGHEPLRAWFERFCPDRQRPLAKLDRERLLSISGRTRGDG